MLLISDANIIIDMHDGGLLEAMFRLGEEFAVPDLLYAEELEQRHPQLPRLGLHIKGLSGESVSRVMVMKVRYPSPSTNDLFALELARQCHCPLLTGDKDLRNAAAEEGIEIRGTLWLVEALVRKKVITMKTAHEAYEKMRNAGSRLPWKEAERRLREME